VYGKAVGSKEEKNVIKIESIEVGCKVDGITMRSDVKSGAFVINSLNDGIGDRGLVAKVAGGAKGGCPGESHVIGNKGSAVSLSGAGAGVKEEILEFITKDRKKIRGEWIILGLGENFPFIDCVACKIMEMGFNEIDMNRSKLFVLHFDDAYLMCVEEVVICS
jgi:hypothetical protein